jgi:hypothetical protein
MAKTKKRGGKQVILIPRVSEEDRKTTVNFSIKSKLVDTLEKRARFKMAVYQFVKDVYEPNEKINEK